MSLSRSGRPGALGLYLSSPPSASFSLLGSFMAASAWSPALICSARRPPFHPREARRGPLSAGRVGAEVFNHTLLGPADDHGDVYSDVVAELIIVQSRISDGT